MTLDFSSINSCDQYWLLVTIVQQVPTLTFPTKSLNRRHQHLLRPTIMQLRGDVASTYIGLHVYISLMSAHACIKVIWRRMSPNVNVFACKCRGPAEALHASPTKKNSSSAIMLDHPSNTEDVKAIQGGRIEDKWIGRLKSCLSGSER